MGLAMSNFGKVFVSYAREDIDHIYNLRRAAGPLVSTLWWDAHLKRSDPNWRRTITTTIEHASAVFILCSPNARQSEADWDRVRDALKQLIDAIYSIRGEGSR